jgi:glycine/D-amino acid oxidase-like deaminating enzyme/nitrite reductase/ring-hydroxylating ferredoxin subunit
MATSPEIKAPALTHSTETEVCIVGAGIAGLSVAYHLAKLGKNVVVVDDGRIAGGETCRTTAHLVSAIDDRIFEIERLHGPDSAKLAVESHRRAIDRIDEIVREENIDCDFERLDGYLFNPPAGDAGLLKRELEAAHRAGLNDVELVSRAPLGDFDTGPALRFPRQGQFHILKYLRGLARAIQEHGGRLYSHTHVTKVTGGSKAAAYTAAEYKIACQTIVVATNVPVNDRVAIHTKQMPYRTYVIGASVPAGSVTKALFWDTGDPYHYVRLQRAQDETEVLLVGGEDHKTGQANDAASRFARLEEWTRTRWPQVGPVDHHWSGQVAEPQDGLAFIGRNPLDEANVYIATGDSGMGMTHGTIAGMLICDLITDHYNPWEKLYDPRRIRLGAAGEFLKENLNTFSEYKEWVTPGEVASIDNVMPCEGAIVRSGLTKVAAYRAPDGTLYECSAVCPHLGGIVQWNSLEKTWDCPAHGSRFDRFGNVVNGPANAGLKKVAGETEDTHKAA